MVKRNAFTLVEVLVVMGVIGVLAGILLPVVNLVRKSAAQAACASNLRQVTLAVLTYATENDSQLPYCNWTSSIDSDWGYECGWMFSEPASRASYPGLSGNWLSLPHPPQNGVQTGVLWPYLKRLEVYRCQMDDNQSFWTGSEWLSSYLMNGAQCGYGRVGNSGNSTQNQPGLRLFRFTAPTQSVMFWEALEQSFMGEQNTYAVWNDGSSYPNEEVMAARHYRGANISCYDGHVECWDQSTWKYWVNYPQIGRLWCDPLTSDGR